MPAPQLRAVETSPLPDRANLRVAIARVTTAQAAVTQAEAARDKVHGQYLAALRSLDTARDKLREAEADNQQHRVAHLLGEATVGPALSDLKRAVKLAETVAAGARADEELLDDEIRRRRQTLDFATSARDAIVADTLRPAANALLQRFQEAQGTAAALRGALSVLPLDALPAFWSAEQTYAEDIALNARWRDTVAALSTDPDAAIPD